MPKAIVADKLALEVHFCRYYCSQHSTCSTLRQAPVWQRIPLFQRPSKNSVHNCKLLIHQILLIKNVPTTGHTNWWPRALEKCQSRLSWGQSHAVMMAQRKDLAKISVYTLKDKHLASSRQMSAYKSNSCEGLDTLHHSRILDSLQEVCCKQWPTSCILQQLG